MDFTDDLVCNRHCIAVYGKTIMDHMREFWDFLWYLKWVWDDFFIRNFLLQRLMFLFLNPGFNRSHWYWRQIDASLKSFIYLTQMITTMYDYFFVFWYRKKFRKQSKFRVNLRRKFLEAVFNCKIFNRLIFIMFLKQ